MPQFYSYLLVVKTGTTLEAKTTNGDATLQHGMQL